MSKQEYITLGKVTTAYGVRGWVKIYSYTQPMDAILEYSPWVLCLDGERKTVKVVRGRSHGDGMVAYLEGVDSREAAAALRGGEILVAKSLLPDLPEGEFYWHQLIGMRVINLEGQDLGKIIDLMSAGSANDVLIVRGDATSIDEQERLIPYVMDRYVKTVDLVAGLIHLDWSSEY